MRRPVGGADGRWTVHIDRNEVKNEVPIDGVFTRQVSAILQRYVDVFRPVLLTSSSSRLFISRNGSGKDPHTLSSQFRRLVKRETGLVMNAHLVRHWAAFAYLKTNPGDYETVRQFLGHKNIGTTINAYAGADTKDALDRYSSVIAPPPDPSSLKFVKAVPLGPKTRTLNDHEPEDMV